MAVIIPSSVPSLPAAVTAAVPPSADVRMGTVVARGRQFLRVRIADAPAATNAGWLMSYRPILGDVVAVSRQGGSWVVLGSLGGSLGDNNDLANYSFEDGAVGSLPPRWSLVTTAGSPNLTTVAWNRDDGVDGGQVAALVAISAGTITTEIISDPVSIASGGQWIAAGYYRTLVDFAASSSSNIRIFLSWYSDTTLGSLISSEDSGQLTVGRDMDWQLQRVQGTEGFSPPIDAAWARLRVRVTPWVAGAGDAIYFDRMILRRIR